MTGTAVPSRRSRATEWDETITQLVEGAIQIDNDLSQTCHMLGTPVPITPKDTSEKAARPKPLVFHEIISDKLDFLGQLLAQAHKKSESLRMEVFLNSKEV
jgi:hypothetical protein